MFESMIVYYLTGTGNSFRVANWMAEEAANRGIRAEIAAGEKAQPEKELTGDAGQLFGLVFPVHGFTAPWHVIRFALSLPRRKGTPALIAVPRGATKIRRLPMVPGMEGVAGYLIALILTLKGYSVRGVSGIDTPSNWMSLHSALSSANAELVQKKSKRQTLSLLDAVLSGRTYYNGVIPLLIGLSLLPLSVLYLAVGRFWLSKLFFASNACTGCGICAQNCPVGGVVMFGRKSPRPYWKFSCESCMRCMGYCPEKAVEAGHSLGAILFYVATIPAGVFMIEKLILALPGMGFVSEGSIFFLAQYVYAIASLWLSYLLFHLLSRVPLINQMFTWTTLTHFFDRYHDAGTNPGDFKGKN